MTHPALTPGSVAVVTGGAAGIGLAAAKRFAGLGLRVAIADLGADRLARAAEEIAALSAGRRGRRHGPRDRRQPRRRRSAARSGRAASVSAAPTC